MNRRLVCAFALLIAIVVAAPATAAQRSLIGQVAALSKKQIKRLIKAEVRKQIAGKTVRLGRPDPPASRVRRVPPA